MLPAAAWWLISSASAGAEEYGCSREQASGIGYEQ
jgi:hypothetical protein